MYIGASASTSPTFAAVAGAKIEGGAGKAVKFDASGNIVLCSAAGEAALGFLILQTADVVNIGDSVTVQIQGIGQAVAGGTIAAGDLLAVDASGQVTKGAAGNSVVGQALAAATAGGFVEFILCRGGQLAAAD